MILAFGGFDQTPAPPVSEINVTPLVDVMLVLLVIFLITAPLFTHAVRLDLPRAQAQTMQEKPDILTLSIDPDGRLYWNNALVAIEELRELLKRAAARQPQPELRLYADRDTRYQQLAEVMALAQGAGMQRMGFVTDPNRKR